MPTPWAVDADLDGEEVKLTAYLSTDPGPMRRFRPFLELTLDEAHAVQLLGELLRATTILRERREAAVEAARPVVVPIGERP